MGKPATGRANLPLVVDIALLKDLVNDWKPDIVGVSGRACQCPVANLLAAHFDWGASVDYDEAVFTTWQRTGHSARLTEDVSKLIIKIDHEFEGRSVPTEWFKAEVERIAG